MLAMEEGVAFAVQLGEHVFEGGAITFREGADSDLVNCGRLQSQHTVESRTRNHGYL